VTNDHRPGQANVHKTNAEQNQAEQGKKVEKYLRWVTDNVTEPPLGQCGKVANLLVRRFSELRRIDGRYICPVLGSKPHAWCVLTPDGQIVDGTAGQFPSNGSGEYHEHVGAFDDCPSPAYAARLSAWVTPGHPNNSDAVTTNDLQPWQAFIHKLNAEQNQAEQGKTVEQSYPKNTYSVTYEDTGESFTISKEPGQAYVIPLEAPDVANVAPHDPGPDAPARRYLWPYGGPHFTK